VSKVQAFIESAQNAPVTRRDTDARLARIRAAVIEECVERSFRQATMANIAKRARVSTASLYREFGNREALLEQVAHFTAPLIAADFTAEVTETEPKARLLALLIHHGRIYQNPHANWLYRAHVSGEVGQGRGLIPVGTDTSLRIEAFWVAEIKRLQDVGMIGTVNMRETVNFMLGGVQRRSLGAILLFGPEDVSSPSLEEAAQSAVDWLFALHGTGSIAKPLTTYPTVKTPTKSRIQMQVEADLARPHERTEVPARYQKIIAAAVQECSEVGFCQSSMASVSRRAVVSTATIYEHFADKDDMFSKAVSYMMPILTDAVTRPAKTANPHERIAAMLIAHGNAYLDPFMAWLYRLYVSFEGQDASMFGNLGKASRTLTEQYWHDQLRALQNDGYLLPGDETLTINSLLGPIERRSLMGFLLFGRDHVSFEEVVVSAQHATNALFTRYGTAKYFAEFGAKAPALEVA
jgi:AcrR family transcriptional regulator